MAENVNVVQKAAQQRYFNKASGRMETAQAMKGYHAPHPAPATRPQGRSQPPREPSLISLTPAQILQRAQKVVGSEVQAERLPFQQRTTELGQQRVGTLQAHAQNYGQFNTSIANQQTAQQASAKTFLNTAADAVKKAGEAAPGAAETAERLGLKPGEQLPESVRRQQESAKTLLQGITGASQAGTIQRQQSEADFLTNLKVAAEKQNVEGAGRIGSEYTQLGQKNAGEEARLLASQRGRVGKYAQGLEGEQERFKTALRTANIDVAKLTAQERDSERSAATTRRGQNLTAGTAAEGHRLTELRYLSDQDYKNRTLAEKTRYDNANISDKEGKLKDLGSKLKLAEEKAGITAGQKATYEREMTTALNAFERGPNLEKKGGGRDYQRIRNELTAGENVKVGGKAKLLKGHATNPVILNAMEQVFRYHYVNPETKKALAALGVPSEGLSNLLLRK